MRKAFAISMLLLAVTVGCAARRPQPFAMQRFTVSNCRVTVTSGDRRGCVCDRPVVVVNDETKEQRIVCQ